MDELTCVGCEGGKETSVCVDKFVCVGYVSGKKTSMWTVWSV